MKLLPKLLAATSIFAATAAIAGPPVTVIRAKTAWPSPCANWGASSARCSS
jgi:hypothetical protein